MITQIVNRERIMIDGQPDFLSEYRGLSSDTKPDGAMNGDKFVEMDTGDVYMFSGASSDWIKLPSGDGGGM